MTTPHRRPARSLVHGALFGIGTWIERSRQRRDLANLPPELLRDIGVSDIDAIRESAKPFWRP